MAKHAIVATLELEPGTRDDVVAALVAHRQRSLRDEPGTLQFEVLVPNDEPNKVVLFELFESEAAFAAHSSAASIATVRQAIGPSIVSAHDVPCGLGADPGATRP